MDEIKHSGRVVSVTAEVTQVEIVRTSACSTCHAKELCGFSEQETKIVEVATSGFDPHQVGDEVCVCMKRSMGMKAVWISYVIPLIVLMLAVLVLSAFKCSEPVVGLGAIGAVAVYYVLILAFRKYLNNEFVFYIK